MSCLQKLTLYIRIQDRDRFIDGTDLEKGILIYMPYLSSFNFYVSTCVNAEGVVHRLSSEDIQQTFTNMRQQNVASIVQYLDSTEVLCTIFSIPFLFNRLEEIGNCFPNIVFSYVTYLMVEDVVPFNNKFFIRVAKAFPFLETLSIFNTLQQRESNVENGKALEIAQFRHLIYLDAFGANINHIEQFLNEKKTYLPCLRKLKIMYNKLWIVTEDFTREETRRNCAGITTLLISRPLVCTKEFYLYFPSLSR